MNQLEKLKAELERSGASLVIANGDVTRTFHGRGILDLYSLYTTEPAFLEGAILADKVIGKGAAALMALGGVREVYGGVVSESALQLLESQGIPASYGTLVPHIINRAGTGMCPVERLCLGAQTPNDCLPAIRDFIALPNFTTPQLHNSPTPQLI